MNEDPTMQVYQQALKKLVDAGGGGQQFRQDQRKLQRTIRRESGLQCCVLITKTTTAPSF